jgi:hypothetical protein
MVHIEGEIVIDRPVGEVFDFVADECNEPRFNPQMRRAEKISFGCRLWRTLWLALTLSNRQ